MSVYVDIENHHIKHNVNLYVDIENHHIKHNVNFAFLHEFSSTLLGFKSEWYTPSQILPYFFISNPRLKYPILSYPIVFYSILFYPILSYPILSYPIRCHLMLFCTTLSAAPCFRRQLIGIFIKSFCSIFLTYWEIIAHRNSSTIAIFFFLSKWNIPLSYYLMSHHPLQLKHIL